MIEVRWKVSSSRCFLIESGTRETSPRLATFQFLIWAVPTWLCVNKLTNPNYKAAAWMFGCCCFHCCFQWMWCIFLRNRKTENFHQVDSLPKWWPQFLSWENPSQLPTSLAGHLLSARVHHSRELESQVTLKARYPDMGQRGLNH